MHCYKNCLTYIYIKIYNLSRHEPKNNSPGKIIVKWRKIKCYVKQLLPRKKL